MALNVSILDANGALMANNGSNGIRILEADGTYVVNTGSNGINILDHLGAIRPYGLNVPSYSILATNGSMAMTGTAYSILNTDGSQAVGDKVPTYMNGDFAINTSGWAIRTASNGVITWNAGALRFVRGVGTSTAASQLVTNFVVGVNYTFSGRIRTVSGGGTCSLLLRTNDGGGGSALLTVGSNSSATFSTVTNTWTATATQGYISIQASVDGATVEGDDIVIKRT